MIKKGEGRSLWINIAAGLLFTAGLSALTIAGWQGYLFKTYPVQLWLLLIFCTALVASLFRLWLHYRRPGYVRKYRKDVIDGIGWGWEYDDKNKVINAEPFCPECWTPAQIQLHKDLSGPHMLVGYCPNHNKGFQSIGGIDSSDSLRDYHAVPKIRQKITSGKWKESK
jgi:hypothetical protein